MQLSGPTGAQRKKEINVGVRIWARPQSLSLARFCVNFLRVDIKGGLKSSNGYRIEKLASIEAVWSHTSCFYWMMLDSDLIEDEWPDSFQWTERIENIVKYKKTVIYTFYSSIREIVNVNRNCQRDSELHIERFMWVARLDASWFRVMVWLLLLRDSLSCIPPRLSQSALRWTMRIHPFSLSAYLSSSSTQINMSSGPTLCLSWYGTLRQAHIRVISLPDCTFDRLGYRVRYIIGMGHILYESIPHWTSWLKHIWHKARRSQWQPRIHPHI